MSSVIDHKGIIHFKEENECYTEFNDYEVQEGGFVKISHDQQKSKTPECESYKIEEKYDPR